MIDTSTEGWVRLEATVSPTESPISMPVVRRLDSSRKPGTVVSSRVVQGISIIRLRPKRSDSQPPIGSMITPVRPRKMVARKPTLVAMCRVEVA